MKNKTLIDALTIGAKEERLAISYMRVHHHEWIHECHNDYYILDNGEGQYYADLTKDYFATRLHDDIGLDKDDAVKLVVHYFNNLVGSW